jgi:hypothetical protein
MKTAFYLPLPMNSLTDKSTAMNFLLSIKRLYFKRLDAYKKKSN